MTPAVDKGAIHGAHVERQYLESLAAKDYENAIRVVRQHAEVGELDRRLRGWLFQLAARAADLWRSTTLTEQLQRTAFSANNLLLPPKATIPYEPLVNVDDQAANIMAGIAQFALRRGYLRSFEDRAAWLTPSATSNQFEEALKGLGEFLGFRGQRPEHEYRVGPDVLWLAGEDLGFVIECKSQKSAANPLDKKEHGQLLAATEWFKKEYAKHNAVRVIVHPNDLASKEASAHDTWVLTLARLSELVAAVRHLLDKLCSSQVETKVLEKQCALLLREHGLTPPQMIEHYFRKFKVVTRAKKK